MTIKKAKPENKSMTYTEHDCYITIAIDGKIIQYV